MQRKTEYTIPNELAIIVLSSFKVLDDKTENSISNLLNQNVNWELFLKYLQQHRLIPPVYLNLKKFENAIPENIIVQLKKNNEHNVFRMMMLASETMRLITMFREAGVRLLPLKGPILSYQLYNNVCLRSSRDIDFLVKPDDFSAGFNMLLSQGYILSPDYADFKIENFAYYQKLKHNISVFHPVKKIFIELHWRLSFHNFFTFSDNKVENIPVKTITYNNTDIEVIADNFQLLYLAVHGSKHKWASLYWLKDFTDFANMCNNIEDTISLAKHSGAELTVYQGLELAKKFYGLECNIDFNPPKKLIHIAESEILNPSERSKINDIKRVFYFMKLKKSIFYKLGCLWGLFYRLKVKIYVKILAHK